VRSGAGISANNTPFWYGHIPAKNRFNGVAAISSGRHLDSLSYKGRTSEIISDVIVGVGSNTNNKGGFTSDNGEKLIVYASLVFDGQRGESVKLYPFVDSDFAANLLYTDANLDVTIKISTANLNKLPRLDAIDIFVAEANTGLEDAENFPAYFVGRIDMNDQGEYFLEQTGVLDSGAQTITIADSSSWHTFSLNEAWCYDVTNDRNYLIDTDLDSSGSRVMTIRAEGDTIPASGSASLKFYLGWHLSGGFYWYYFKTDNFYIKAGSEMYDYLGMPKGDNGIDDLRFKYMAVSGGRSLVASMPGENQNRGYYSKAGDYDVFPVLNEVQFIDVPVGVIDVRDDSFFVFYKNSMEMITVFSNQQFRREDDFQNVGCVGPKAFTKIDDNTVAVFDQSGPYIVGVNRVEFIGDPIGDWWQEKLSESVKSGCVVAYDKIGEQVLFSFPDYNTTPFTGGIVFSYDLRAVRRSGGSPWYILYTDEGIGSAAIASDGHLLTADADGARDWNSESPEESFEAWIKLKMLENAEFDKRVNLKRVNANFSGSLVLEIFKDKSATANISRTLSSRVPALIHTVADDIELKFNHVSGSGQNIKNIIFDIQELRK
jgi:hypothetical protein